jgi:hypothetical protein
MKHGTTGGYQGHIKRGEEICDACREAQHVYRQAYLARGGERIKRKQARNAAARNRALSQLAANHPDEYHELRLEELAKIPPVKEG